MAIVLPHGILFRSSTEGAIRKNLIENPSGNRIYAVIGLPSNLFYGTSIPTTILVLKKNRTTKDILFIDASNYNLNIPRYVDAFEEEEPIDIAEVQQLLARDKEEIAELEREIAEQLKILGIK